METPTNLPTLVAANTAHACAERMIPVMPAGSNLDQNKEVTSCTTIVGGKHLELWKYGKFMENLWKI